MKGLSKKYILLVVVDSVVDGCVVEASVVILAVVAVEYGTVHTDIISL